MKYEKISPVETEEIEIWLKPFINEITCLARGKIFGTFEVRFKTEEQTRNRSSKVLKVAEWILLPAYIGRTSKVKINNVPPPPEADIVKLVAAVTF